MLSKMVTMIVLVIALFFASAKASMVEVNSLWRPNFGWDVTCKWQLYANDSLQSVRLYRGREQFMIYRPERDGSTRSTHIRLPDMELHVDCYETQGKDVTGQCIMSLEIFQPIREDLSYTCEVSGERPMFRQDAQTVIVEALVPPTEAVVVGQSSESSARVHLNCSSTGLPPPVLLWTIGDQKIPQDYYNKVWNVTSKLYDVWSTLSYTPTEHRAVCTPQIIRGRVVEGLSGTWSGASGKESSVVISVLSVVLLALTR